MKPANGINAPDLRVGDEVLIRAVVTKLWDTAVYVLVEGQYKAIVPADRCVLRGRDVPASGLQKLIQDGFGDAA